MVQVKIVDMSTSREIDATADRLHSIAIHLLRRVRAEDVGMGITAPRASALSVLVFKGPMKMSTLAALEQVRAPTMSKVVEALVKAGLARRTKDPLDGRVLMIDATPAGRRLLRDGQRRRVRVLATLLARLSKADRHTLDRAVQLLEALVQVPGPTLGKKTTARR
jgi:DNA-binding MarR family transcriptional regulator